MSDDKPISMLRSGGLHDFKDSGKVAPLEPERKAKIELAYRLANSNIYCNFCHKKIVLEEGIGEQCPVCKKNFCTKHTSHEEHVKGGVVLERLIHGIKRLFKK